MGPPRWPEICRYGALALLIFVSVPACRCEAQPSGGRAAGGAPVTSSQGFGVMALKGPEVWTIDGKPFQIRATYFVVVEGRLQFTIDYLCGDRCPEFVGLSERVDIPIRFDGWMWAAGFRWER